MAMELDEAIRGRRSIRAFRGEPIPDSIVREILDKVPIGV
jgi:nitroreductase